MANRPRPADAIVLSLRARPPTAADARRHELRHFTAFGQVDPPRTSLFGFSFGGELAGLPAGAEEGLALADDAEVAADPILGDPDLRGPLYRLRIDHYLERLRREKVNYLKVLVFDERKPHFSPFATDAEGAAAGERVSGISPRYLERLEELVRKARQRGIVIVLSLFASRMLREPGWLVSPFNARNNNTGDALGAGSFITGSPLERFCVVREPPAGRRFDVMSVPEKLFVVQRELVTGLVETVRRYWNVVFEICDDPRGPGDPGAMTEVVEWHVTVAGWLAALLTDRRGRRRRCVEVNAGPRLRGALLDALGAREDAAGGSLVDLVHLRGGEWGGYPGASASEACGLRSTEGPGQALYAPAAIGDGIDHREVAWDGVGAALARLARRPVSAVLDTDGHHLAQKLPRPYLEAARASRAHFLYRWPATSLHRVDVARESCEELGAQGQVCPPRGRAGRSGCVTFGLDQRLEQLSAPDPDPGTTVFPLPPAPEPPRLRAATVADHFIELVFDPPPVAPEGYALFVGSTPESAWEGTEIFPDPLPVELTATGGRVRLPPVTRAMELHVALAATRGVLTSDLSEAVGPLVLIPTGSELVEVDLPSEVETRRDFHGSLTFVNTSSETWRGPEMGVLLEARGLQGGLARLFFPLGPENLGDRPAEIAPGQPVRVDLRRMVLDGAFAETYGSSVPALLPYARGPLRLRAGMARRQDIPRPDAERPDIVITPVGETAERAVLVRQPRRLATRHVPETQTLVRKGFVLPLADGIDRSLHLTSLTAESGTPGTIIRAQVMLERLVKDEGLATRVLRLAHDRNEPVSVNVEVVRLHPIDAFYGLPARPPRHRPHALVASGSEALSLGAFAGGFTVSIASSETAFPGGEAVHWETLAATPGRGSDRLAVRNVTARETRVVTFTTELVEDAGPGDPRLTTGVVTFAPGAGPQHVPLGDGQTHRFLVHRLAADGEAVARGQIVLRAGDDGRFERVLEIAVDAHAGPVAVTWQVLEVVVDASDAVNREPADLHPALAARVLQFFNSVEEARQIVDTIRDNRAYHRDTRRAYAVRPKLATSILAARRRLPGGQFTTVEQIAAVTGVGVDTFEDIAFSFQDDGTPLSQIA